MTTLFFKSIFIPTNEKSVSVYGKIISYTYSFLFFVYNVSIIKFEYLNLTFFQFEMNELLFRKNLKLNINMENFFIN